MGRPDIDSADFVSIKPYSAGDAFSAPELKGNWSVVDVLYAPDGERDTLNVGPRTAS